MAIAARQGIRVHAAHLPEGDVGYYSPDEARIYFDLSLTPVERRCVIAHELGHAHYGHREDSPRNERLADVYAAGLLIDPDRYAALERVNSDQHFLADELDVTLEVVETFEKHCLTKLRGVTYVRPRMGIAQWSYRGVHAHA